MNDLKLVFLLLLLLHVIFRHLKGEVGLRNGLQKGLPSRNPLLLQQDQKEKKKRKLKKTAKSSWKKKGPNKRPSCLHVGFFLTCYCCVCLFELVDVGLIFGHTRASETKPTQHNPLAKQLFSNPVGPPPLDRHEALTFPRGMWHTLGLIFNWSPNSHGLQGSLGIDLERPNFRRLVTPTR